MGYITIWEENATEGNKIPIWEENQIILKYIIQRR